MYYAPSTYYIPVGYASCETNNNDVIDDNILIQLTCPLATLSTVSARR